MRFLGIAPRGIEKSIPEALYHVSESDDVTVPVDDTEGEKGPEESLADAEIKKRLVAAAEALDFEMAPYYQDLLRAQGEKPSGDGIVLKGPRGGGRRKKGR